VWVVISLLICIVAAVLGFGGIGIGAPWVAQALFFVFMIVALVSFARSTRQPDDRR
jgi:uncharacterized membrane protein YtjA (UPF0391 family)